jgi:hypothetical protein
MEPRVSPRLTPRLAERLNTLSRQPGFDLKVSRQSYGCARGDDPTRMTGMQR